MDSFKIYDRDTIYSIKNNIYEEKIKSELKILIDIKRKLMDKFSTNRKNTYKKRRDDSGGWKIINKNSNILKPTDEDDKIKKKIIGILNKLTPSNIEKLTENLKEILTTELFVKSLIDGIFQNAIIQPNNCTTYVELCILLSNFILEKYDIDIQKFLLEKSNCFLDEFKEIKEIDNNNYDEYCNQIKKKLSNVGNIQLLSELYKNNIIESTIIDEIFELLLKNTAPENIEINNEEYIMNNIDSLLKLVSLVYKKNPKYLIDNLKIFEERRKNKAYSSKSRFIFMDILDLSKKI